MNVLFISSDFPPLTAGGYELQCHDVTKHLRGAGHRVRVLAGEAAPATSDTRDAVHRDLPRFPVEPAPAEPMKALDAENRAAAVLGHHLREFRADVVCLWRLGELSMSLPARAAATGVPLVGVVCDPWMIDGPQRDPWSRRHGTSPLPDATRWLFVSRALRNQVDAAGIRTGDAQIVAAGVDLSAFPYTPVDTWRGRLLYAGRLSPLKGVDMAIEALARLPDGITLDIVGDGRLSYVRLLRRMANALGIARRVRFHGSLPRRRLATAYGTADALLFPIRWPEPFGLVPLEAMASGTPVIAVAAGGAADHLRDGETALVVPPEDPTALAAAVVRLESDPALRERLRARGRHTAERHPADRANEAVAAALDDAAPAHRTLAHFRAPPASSTRWVCEGPRSGLLHVARI